MESHCSSLWDTHQQLLAENRNLKQLRQSLQSQILPNGEDDGKGAMGMPFMNIPETSSPSLKLDSTVSDSLNRVPNPQDPPTSPNSMHINPFFGIPQNLPLGGYYPISPNPPSTTPAHPSISSLAFYPTMNGPLIMNPSLLGDMIPAIPVIPSNIMATGYPKRNGESPGMQPMMHYGNIPPAVMTLDALPQSTEEQRNSAQQNGQQSQNTLANGDSADTPVNPPASPPSSQLPNYALNRGIAQQMPGHNWVLVPGADGHIVPMPLSMHLSMQMLPMSMTGLMGNSQNNASNGSVMEANGTVNGSNSTETQNRTSNSENPPANNQHTENLQNGTAFFGC
eukprot:TRINITY_DN4093_c0_g1_i2.p1 TRINITY_DN4093_c0_g1~~TRINITY_DN4093_c0_g1_i2.p1  ORF type:complete len:338 (-),score=75.38 TRINITY_DN4093_c0_g1_i2:94-1107(-)